MLILQMTEEKRDGGFALVQYNLILSANSEFASEDMSPLIMSGDKGMPVIIQPIDLV